ncbi:restriction endonuclease subunit S, partial [Escherichia coli]
NTIFPDTMWRLAVDEKFIKKEFLMYYLMSPYGRRAIQGIAAGTSGSMKKINKDNFLKIQIPIPPFDIQASIINTFKCSYENIYRHNESLGKIIQLRQAMIDKEI